MRALFDTIHAQPPRLVTALRDDEARLLWALRRLALMMPLGWARCRMVHVALQQDFGAAGLGIEHLLRCLLVGLARLATRRLALGTPGCAVVTGDEAALLAILVRPEGSDAALVALAGPAAMHLLPLFEALRQLVDGQRGSR